MAVTSVDIDEQLLRDAMEVFGPNATKAATIRGALELAVRTNRQRQTIDWLADEDPLADLRDEGVRRDARR